MILKKEENKQEEEEEQDVEVGEEDKIVIEMSSRNKRMS